MEVGVTSFSFSAAWDNCTFRIRENLQKTVAKLFQSMSIVHTVFCFVSYSEQQKCHWEELEQSSKVMNQSIDK